MPRKNNEDKTFEDTMILETQDEIEEFMESYQIGGFDAYRDAYDDMNFDMDNYGYDY
ncbi:MAG: hypothetical protein ACK5XN_29905 [Bacteroidota bacterium]|jgi:hypothetical protein